MSARTAGVVRALGWMACISASSSYRARHRAQSAKRAPPAQNEPDPNNVLQPNNLRVAMQRNRSTLRISHVGLQSSPQSANQLSSHTEWSLPSRLGSVLAEHATADGSNAVKGDTLMMLEFERPRSHVHRVGPLDLGMRSDGSSEIAPQSCRKARIM